MKSHAQKAREIRERANEARRLPLFNVAGGSNKAEALEQLLDDVAEWAEGVGQDVDRLKQQPQQQGDT